MSDYLRARIDALEIEVQKLRKQVDFYTAQLEVAKENFSFNYYTENNLKS